MIDLRGRLVVPRAPGLCAINGDDRALVTRKHHAIPVSRIDPKLMVVIATGRTLYRNPRLASIQRHIGSGVNVISAISIGRVDGDLPEVPPTSPEALFAVDQPPCCTGVVRKVDASGGLRRWGLFSSRSRSKP